MFQGWFSFFLRSWGCLADHRMTLQRRHSLILWRMGSLSSSSFGNFVFVGLVVCVVYFLGDAALCSDARCHWPSPRLEMRLILCCGVSACEFLILLLGCFDSELIILSVCRCFGRIAVSGV